MTRTLRSDGRFPPTYAAALTALRACAKAFTPERYVLAGAALCRCWEVDECAEQGTEAALAAYSRMAMDDTMMRLAGKIDAMRKSWLADQARHGERKGGTNGNA